MDAGGDSRVDADISSFLVENADGGSKFHRPLDRPETIRNPEIRLLSAREKGPKFVRHESPHTYIPYPRRSALGAA